jgi:rhodanese-related sulfurtransferase
MAMISFHNSNNLPVFSATHICIYFKAEAERHSPRTVNSTGMARSILYIKRTAAKMAVTGTLALLSGMSIAAAPFVPSHAMAAQVELDDISLAEAKTLFDGRKACFVDARSEYVFYTSHIKGARSLSSSRFDEQFVEFRQQIPAETLIVVYCINNRCGKARDVAHLLKKNGYRNVRVFVGGIAEWNKAGYPLET